MGQAVPARSSDVVPLRSARSCDHTCTALIGDGCPGAAHALNRQKVEAMVAAPGSLRALLELPNLSIRGQRDTALLTDESTLADKERRKRLRFPLNTELRYQISGRGHGDSSRGTGRVRDICSRGLAFRADGPLEPGWRLSVSMAWPAKLDNQCMLRLGFEGVVLRTHGSLVVLTIEHPEFRTAGKSTAAALEEIAATASGIGALYAFKGVPPGVLGAA